MSSAEQTPFLPWSSKLRRLGRNLGVLGHKDYTRFIVLGRSRTGSNFLRGLLNSHSQIMVFGELFRNYDAVDWAYPGYHQTDRMMAQMQQDPVGILESKVFGRVPRKVRAVGFKLFYYHAHDHGWERLWGHLQGQPNLRILHVKRRNLLAVHLSRARALRSGRWVKTSGDGSQDHCVVLDYDECLADFVQTRGWEEQYDRFFVHQPRLDLIYEDLAGDYQATMRRVQAFLHVDFESLTPETHKQAGERLSTAIANYDELKQRFAGTPWEEVFED